MDNTLLINQRVEVVVVFRKAGDVSRICLPARMRYKGQDIVLEELGFRHPTIQGKRMVHVFDVSDGVNDYRLEFDAEGLTWTLITMLPGDAVDKSGKEARDAPLSA
jgi:hypothetical protein